MRGIQKEMMVVIERCEKGEEREMGKGKVIERERERGRKRESERKSKERARERSRE